MIKAGAQEYCHVESDSLFLRKAIELVQKGEIWAGRSILFRLLKETHLSRSFTPNNKYYSRREFDTLTDREREIAYFIGRGMSNKEIASQIDVAEATVKAHLTSIFDKLRVSDRLELGLLISRPAAGKYSKEA